MGIISRNPSQHQLFADFSETECLPMWFLNAQCKYSFCISQWGWRNPIQIAKFYQVYEIHKKQQHAAGSKLSYPQHPTMKHWPKNSLFLSCCCIINDRGGQKLNDTLPLVWRQQDIFVSHCNPAESFHCLICHNTTQIPCDFIKKMSFPAFGVEKT